MPGARRPERGGRRSGRPPPRGAGARSGAPRHDAADASSREVALFVLDRVRSGEAYANLTLPRALERAGLGPRDAAFATELTYGTLRRLGTLDWVLGLLSDRPLDALDPRALDALRLGAYQLLYADVPPYAAVSATVACVRARGAAGYVNAVLRRLARERPTIPWPSPEGDRAAYLQIVHSHPSWMVKLWLDELGPRDAEALCRANNEAPAVGVRAADPADRDELAARFARAGIRAEPGRWSPAAMSVTGGGAPSRWPGFAEGKFAVMDEASILAGEALGQAPGDVVVDLCAGPGGKTAQLAARAGRVVAADVHHARAGLVREACRRLAPAARVAVVQADGRLPPVTPGVDAVLVDAPCTGLGVLRRRPEARWRVRAADVARAAETQRQLVRSAFGILRRGGSLVYAVCTVTAAETTDVVEWIRSHEPEAQLVDVHPQIPRPAGRPGATLQLLPHVHGTDGMFVAKLTNGRDG